MIHVTYSKWIVLCSTFGVLWCVPHKESNEKQQNQASNVTKDVLKIDTMSFAFKVVNDSKMKQFYYDFYALKPWSSSGLSRSVYIDSILKDRNRSFPTLISYMGSKNDSLRITAYELLTEASGLYPEYMYYVKDTLTRKTSDSIQVLFVNWWKEGGHIIPYQPTRVK